MGTIVVGVDGSESSVAALRFAVGEARLRGDSVRAVCAWHVPAVAYGAGFAPTPEEMRELEREAGDRLAGALEAAGDDAQAVAVERVLVEGPSVPVLVEAARGADALVVGSRGLHGVRGLVAGSVSRECCRLAPCPVIVVRARSAPRSLPA